MHYFKSTIRKLSTSSFSVLFIGMIILASNLAWFLPTVSSLRKSVSDIERATVRTALIKIESFLYKKESDITVPARFIEEPLDSSKNSLLLQKILKEEHLASVVLSDKNGNEIIKYDKFKAIFVEDLRNILERSDFKETIRMEQASWSKVSVSEKFEPFVTLNIPVFSVQKELTGVVSATINVSSVFKSLLDVISDKEKAYVTDSKGVVISDPDLSIVLRGSDYSNRRIVREALSGGGEIIVADDDTYAYKNEHGVKVLAAAAKVSKVGWVVVFEEPKNVAVANITKLVIFAIGSFVFVSFLIFVMRRINLKVSVAQKELEKNFLAQKELFREVDEAKNEVEKINNNLKEKDDKLAEKVVELENFQKFVVDRELRMVELKQEIVALKKRAGEGVHTS